jgi:YidC/Oxa1 family membrane protein insertase
VVFLGLFALLGVVAWSSSRWQAKQAQGPAPVRLVPYGTVLMVSVIPLAAGRYLLVTNAWTMAERVVFYA